MTTKKVKKQKIDFESAMENLEELVVKLENGELSLEESLSTFEEGMKLAVYCEKELQAASGKVEKIMKDFSGAETLTEISADELEDLKGV